MAKKKTFYTKTIDGQTQSRWADTPSEAVRLRADGWLKTDRKTSAEVSDAYIAAAREAGEKVPATELADTGADDGDSKTAAKKATKATSTSTK